MTRVPLILHECTRFDRCSVQRSETIFDDALRVTILQRFFRRRASRIERAAWILHVYRGSRRNHKVNTELIRKYTSLGKHISS